MYTELADFIFSTFIILGVFFLLLNLERVLLLLNFFVTIFVVLVQELYDRVTIKMNGGHDYGKKQRDIKRTRSYRPRR